MFYSDELHEKINIYVKRVLSCFSKNSTQILFQEKRDPQTGEPQNIKEPLSLIIQNSKETQFRPITCANYIIFKIIENPNNKLIFKNKSRIKIVFKVYLILEIEDISLPIFLVLPNDIGTKCYSHYDLSTPQNCSSSEINESLQIIENNFVYSLEIPLIKYSPTLTQEQIENPTLSGHVVIENLIWNLTATDKRSCNLEKFNSHSIQLNLSIFEDITAKIDINQNLLIEGIPIDTNP